jgi:hypothetical protein
MAALKRWKFLTDNLAAKLLSLAIATVFWLSVTADRDIRKDFTVPLKVANIPSGLTIAGYVPGSVDLSVSGPEILFLTHDLNDLRLTLDLGKTGEGTVSFPDLQRYVDLPSGMQVIRVYPSSLEMKLIHKEN